MTTNIAFHTQNSTEPRQWLEAQRQIWLKDKARLESEMLQTIEDHSSCLKNLAAVDRLLAIYEVPPT